MAMRKVAVCLILALSGIAHLYASDIEGTIIVKRKLTKRKVTASASSYELRGPAPEPAADTDRDPLAFERSRVVIYLEGETLPSHPLTATLEQEYRRFLPDVLVVPVGSTVSFPNHDPIFHNVFSLSKPKSFDLGNYPKDQTRTVVFNKPGLVFVNCHLHPNMAAVIVVSPNQWSTKAAPDGKFTLPHVPPGKYTIVAWHKTAGFFRKEVQVTEKGLSVVEFLIPLEDKE
jgi:plastocyanin